MRLGGRGQDSGQEETSEGSSRILMGEKETRARNGTKEEEMGCV